MQQSDSAAECEKKKKKQLRSLLAIDRARGGRVGARSGTGAPAVVVGGRACRTIQGTKRPVMEKEAILSSCYGCRATDRRVPGQK